MEVRIKNVRDLTPTEYQACYRANYGFDGYMREQLVLARSMEPPKLHYEGIAILLWDGPEDTTKSLIGWALLTPVRTYGTVAASRYNAKKAKYTAEFWIKAKHRRKGYGTILMDEVKKLDPVPHVFPHDEPSGEMFAKYKVTCDARDRTQWLVGKRKKKVA